MEHNYDFLGIGDITTDAFIKLKDPSTHIDIDKGAREICMRFADKIPYEDVYRIPAVGNAANATVSAARLGLKSAFVSNVGGDYYGGECRRVLEQEKVASEFVKEHAGRNTNYHYVLWYEDDRTILIKHEEYEYALPDIGSPGWIYLSSLGENSLPFHDVLAKYLADHKEIKLAFQPGTYQMRFGKEKLAEFYRRTEAFFCNKEESQRILNSEENDIKNLLKMISALGPKIVVITDGPRGAFCSDGITHYDIMPNKVKVVETTGAGDAFASSLVRGLIKKRDIEFCMRLGVVNAQSVVQHYGAKNTLLSWAAALKKMRSQRAKFSKHKI